MIFPWDTQFSYCLECDAIGFIEGLYYIKELNEFSRYNYIGVVGETDCKHNIHFQSLKILYAPTFKQLQPHLVKLADHTT